MLIYQQTVVTGKGMDGFILAQDGIFFSVRTLQLRTSGLMQQETSGRWQLFKRVNGPPWLPPMMAHT